MSKVEVEHIGRHEVRFQPPNRVHVVMRGTMNAQHLADIHAFVRKWREQYGQPLGVICSFDDFDGMTADARQYAVRMDREYPYFGMAFVGGSFMSRTIVTTIYRAGRRLAPQHFKFAIFLGKSIEECEAWLDSLQA